MCALRVLCVDDHADTCRMLGRALELDGYLVDTAGSVAEARAKLASAVHYDVLVCDLQLPDGNGWDLMAEASACQTVGVAVSGHGYQQDVQHSMAAGFAMHLVKPVALDQLRAAVRGAVAGNQHRGSGTQPQAAIPGARSQAAGVQGPRWLCEGSASADAAG